MTRLQKIKRVKIVVLSSIGAACILAFLGVMIINSLAISTVDRQNLYITAHRVTDVDDFVHLLETAGGRTLVYGTVVGHSGVSHESLNGEWFAIRWQREKYVEEQETYTDDDGDTQTRTVYRWSSYHGGGNNQTHDWSFMDQPLNRMANVSFSGYTSLNPRNYAVNVPSVDSQYIYSTHTIRVGTIRTSFQIIPMTFNGTLFMDLGIGQISCPLGGRSIPFHHGRTVEDVFNRGMRDHTGIISVIWVLLSIGAVIGVVIFKYKIWLKGICLADICPSNLLKHFRKDPWS
jgi:hypothetical protein